MIKFLPEHDVADIIEQDNSQQFTGLFIRHRKHVTMGSGNGFHQLAQIHFRMHYHEVFFHHILHFHQGQDRLILMMCEELPSLGQTHRIDTMRLESNNRQIGTDRYNHQGKKQVITSGQFGNQEYTCQRSMHDSTHNTRHSHQCEILFGQISRKG